MACFYVTISGNFERFEYFNFETDFWKMKTSLKKLVYRFLVDSFMTKAVIIYLWSKSMDWFLYDSGLHHERVKSTKIENASLSYKTPI